MQGEKDNKGSVSNLRMIILVNPYRVLSYLTVLRITNSDCLWLSVSLSVNCCCALGCPERHWALLIRVTGLQLKLAQSSNILSRIWQQLIRIIPLCASLNKIFDSVCGSWPEVTVYLFVNARIKREQNHRRAFCEVRVEDDGIISIQSAFFTLLTFAF